MRKNKMIHEQGLVKKIHDQTFTGVSEYELKGNTYDIIKSFLSIDAFLDVADDMFISFNDDELFTAVYDIVYEFYNNNGKMLKDSFTLTDNYYAHALRELIVSIEQQLQNEYGGQNDND